MKKIYIFIIIFFLIVVAAVFFYMQYVKKSALSKPVVTSPKFPINERITDAPKNVLFHYVGTVPDLPTKLPTVQVFALPTNTSLDALLKSLGGRFSMTSTPTAFIKNDTYFASWADDPVELTLTRSPNYFSFSYALNAISPKAPAFTGSNPLSIVSNFTGILSVDPSYVLTLVSSRNTDFSGLVILDRPVPALTGYSYAFKFNDLRIMSSTYAFLGLEAVLDNQNRPRFIGLSVPPNPKSFGNPVNIISFDSAIASLNQGMGNLVTFGDPTSGELQTPPIFTSVDLKTVELVWLWQQTQYTPIYYFTGSATTASQELQPVSYVLSATTGR